MKIIFVRHGESEYNAGLVENEKGYPELTEKGKKQAEAVGRKLKNYNISEIYTSDLKRSVETGKIISKIIGIPIKESLNELGEYPGEHLRHIHNRVFDIKTENRLRKLRRFLDKISRERDEEKTILIVAHGITNRIIMGYLMKVPLNRKILRFSQDNTCINILRWKPRYGNWNAECINDVGHLPLAIRSASKSLK